MARGKLATALSAVVLAAASQFACAGEKAWPVLHVLNSSDLPRVAEPVSGGVPLPVGAVKDVEQLRLLDSAGREIPAQLSAINRWGADKSVMWLLVQARATVPARGEVTFRVAPGKPKAAKSPLSVKETDEAVTIVTGPLRLAVSKKRFNLIDSASFDANGDGAFAADEQVIKPGHDGGSTFTLANGEVYRSTAGAPDEVVVEESGPERATILVRGRHRMVAGKQGALPYLYGYLVRIRAYAGQPFVRISYTLTNSSTPVIGIPLCRDVQISQSFVLGPRPTETKGVVAAGDGKRSVSAAVRYLAENAPATLAAEEIKGGGRIVLRPWGGEQDYLDIYTHKTYEMRLTFAPGDKAVTNAATDLKRFNTYLRFWPEPAWVSATGAWGDFGSLALPDDEMRQRIVKSFRPFKAKADQPARFAWRNFGSVPSMQSGASWAPSGGYEPHITDGHFYIGYLQTQDRRFFDQLERTSWHWRDRRYEHLNKDVSSGWAGRGGVYLKSWKKAAAKYAAVQAPAPKHYAKAWHYGGKWGPMDVQHFSADETVNYYYLTGDRQCLPTINKLGEQAASVVNQFVKNRKGRVMRTHGWVTRGLISVYEATGEKRWLTKAQEAVGAIVLSQDKRVGAPTDIYMKNPKGKKAQMPWQGTIVAMGLGRYYRHHPDEEVRDAILGVADWLDYDVVRKAGGFSYDWSADDPGKWSYSGHRCMSTMAWAYLATGRQRYLAAADVHSKVKSNLMRYWVTSGFGQEYYTIKHTKRADATPPAAVTDLAAEALGDGKVRLTWTAPGGDAKTGRASEYQIKRADKQIVEHANWRERADSEISFWAATNCKSEPAPAAAGKRQSYIVTGLAAGTHWFALKSYDAQPNQSDLSNVVKLVLP